MVNDSLFLSWLLCVYRERVANCPSPWRQACEPWSSNAKCRRATCRRPVCAGLFCLSTPGPRPGHSSWGLHCALQGAQQHPWSPPLDARSTNGQYYINIQTLWASEEQIKRQKQRKQGVGRIPAPRGAQALISGPCDHVSLCGRKDFADVRNLRILRWEMIQYMGRPRAITGALEHR